MESLKPVFREMEEISLYNTEKVLKAFRKHQLSAFHFAPSNGYGYGDPGREKLEEIWSDVFGAEAALVRPQFVSGTHALATVLLALLDPGDTLLSAAGAPYDTMQSVIGITGNAPHSLKARASATGKRRSAGIRTTSKPSGTPWMKRQSWFSSSAPAATWTEKRSSRKISERSSRR